MSNAEALANRLRKNAKHWDKWARREGLEAYRLYDRDIPEFPYAVDRYADWLHVQLFEPRKPIGAAELDQHLAAIARRDTDPARSPGAQGPPAPARQRPVREDRAGRAELYRA